MLGELKLENNTNVQKITNLCANQNSDEKSSIDLIKSVVIQFEQFQIVGSVNEVEASKCLHSSYPNLLEFETDLIGFEITHATNHNLNSQTVTVREQRRSYYEGSFGAAPKTEWVTEQFILKKYNERWLIVSYSRAN